MNDHFGFVVGNKTLLREFLDGKNPCVSIRSYWKEICSPCDKQHFYRAWLTGYEPILTFLFSLFHAWIFPCLFLCIDITCYIQCRLTAHDTNKLKLNSNWTRTLNDLLEYLFENCFQESSRMNLELISVGAKSIQFSVKSDWIH